MRVCTHCSFPNEERFPTCVLCNTLLVDAPSVPASDPNHPEHEQRALNEKRHRIIRRQLRFAAILYTLVITLTAMFAGLVFSPQVLLLYFISGLIVVFALLRGIVGQLSASLLQGLLSVLLLSYFGPFQPLIFFMLDLHVTVPSVLWHWVDLIHSAHR